MIAKGLPHFRWDGSTISGVFHGSSFQELERGRYLVNDTTGVRFRVEVYKSSLPLIIDEFKTVFGLPKIGKHKVEYLDFSSVLFVREIGFEFPVPSGMYDSYDVYKTRLFRWLLGLSSRYVHADMIARQSHGAVEVISNNDVGVDFFRPNPTFITTLTTKWEPNDTLKEMLYGHSLSSLRETLSDIVLRIDPSMIYYPVQIIDRLNAYGCFLETKD